MQQKQLRGKWEWGESFTYARVIHYYGIWPPSKFWEASAEDRAWAVAHYESEMGIEAWNSYVASLNNESQFGNMTPKDSD